MKNNVFTDDIIVPDEVKSKIENTLALIKEEGAKNMKEKNTNNRKKGFFKNHVVAAVAVCAIGIGGITVAAAVYHNWSDGIRKGMQASEKQIDQLTDDGMVTIYEGNSDYSKLAVTENGVTVTPSMAIVDDYYAKLAFNVSGYGAPSGEQPGFQNWDVKIDGVTDDNSMAYGMGASFYDGLISDENGMGVYDDGTPMEYEPDGAIHCRYVNEEGTMEYIIDISKSDESISLLGKEVHIELSNLGYYGDKAGDIVTEVEGKWSFDVTFPSTSASKIFESGREVECKYNSFIIDEVEISPLSTKIHYSLANGETFVDNNASWDEMPYFKGYVLKDGTRIICNGGAGGSGLEDENTASSFYTLSGHSRLVDIDQIDKMIVLLTPGGEEVYIDLK